MVSGIADDHRIGQAIGLQRGRGVNGPLIAGVSKDDSSWRGLGPLVPLGQKCILLFSHGDLLVQLAVVLDPIVGLGEHPVEAVGQVIENPVVRNQGR